jgi:hypothetical protein
VASFVAFLKRQPHPLKLIVAGNHDLLLSSPSSASPQGFFRVRQLPSASDHAAALALFTDASAVAAGIVLLNGRSAATPGGYTVWGSPVTPKIWGAFQGSRGQELSSHWAQLPEGVHVLLTHGPPHGCLDEVLRIDDDGPEEGGEGEKSLAPSYTRKHVGCEGMRDALRALQQPPAAVVCGHIHEGFGCTVLPRPECSSSSAAPAPRECLILNVASCGLSYSIAHPPVVFSLQGSEAELTLLSPSRAELLQWFRLHPDSELTATIPKELGCLLQDLPENRRKNSF